MGDPVQKLSLHSVLENDPKIGKAAQDRDHKILAISPLTLPACQRNFLPAQ
jgi:hypothetical protein